MWREANSQKPRLTSAAGPRPPFTCRRMWGEAQVCPGTDGLCGGGREDVCGGREGKRREFCKLPRGAPRTPPGKPPVGLPYHRTPCLGPSEGASGKRSPNSGFPGPSAGAPATHPGCPQPRGEPRRGSRVGSFDAALFQPGLDRTPRFPRRAEAFWVPPTTGAPRGPQGPQERCYAFRTSRRLPLGVQKEGRNIGPRRSRTF